MIQNVVFILQSSRTRSKRKVWVGRNTSTGPRLRNALGCFSTSEETLLSVEVVGGVYEAVRVYPAKNDFSEHGQMVPTDEPPPPAKKPVFGKSAKKYSTRL